MKVISLILVFICCGLALATDDPDWSQRFTAFSKKHEKTFEDEAKRTDHLNRYKTNMEAIAKHNQLFNQNQSTFEMGENYFADMNFEEVEKYYMGLVEDKNETKVSSSVSENSCQPGKNSSNFKDWRESGAISEVKDQKRCGSCWAFAAAAGLEAHYFLKTNKSVELSEQMLVNCAGIGCYGGMADMALDYVKRNGIVFELDSVYQAKKGKCKKVGKARIVLYCKSYVRIPYRDEQCMQKVVEEIGPVIVAIEVNRDFVNYRSGVLNTSCTRWPNHEVLVVGYGTEGGQDYWLVKNSWGPDWGDKGYIKMQRNRNNACFIATRGLYPEVYENEEFNNN